MIEIRTPQTPDEWEAYFDLRYRILRAPFDKPRGSERNEGDATGIHFALYQNEVLRAVARLDLLENRTAQVRFVAVETDQQGTGLGRLLMEAVEDACRARKLDRLVLHARDYAVVFYQKLGYTLLGPSYKLFDLLQHFEMEKRFVAN